MKDDENYVRMNFLSPLQRLISYKIIIKSVSRLKKISNISRKMLKNVLGKWKIEKTWENLENSFSNKGKSSLNESSSDLPSSSVVSQFEITSDLQVVSLICRSMYVVARR